MKNAYWSAIYKSSHPCLEWEGFFCTGNYICSCGHKTTNEKEHDDHVIKNHTQEEAYNLLPAKVYNKEYNTQEYQEKKAKQTAHRKQSALISKMGYKKVSKKSIYSVIYDWVDGEGKGYKTSEIIALMELTLMANKK